MNVPATWVAVGYRLAGEDQWIPTGKTLTPQEARIGEAAGRVLVRQRTAGKIETMEVRAR